MMRMIIGLLVLLLALLPGLSAYAAEGDPSADAASMAEQMQRGEYSAVYDRLDAALQALLTEADLEEAWGSVVTLMGPMLRVERVDETVQGETVIYQVIAAHENGNVSTTVAFDAAGAVNLFQIQPVLTQEAPDPLPVPEDAIEETIALRPGEIDETGGTLLLPAGEEPFPVVILLHGSGASDQDESVMSLQSFRDLAIGLCERGIATLRYDKYPFAHPELMQADVSIEREYGMDVRAALSLLETDARVGDIYLLGHSEGGMLVPKYMQENGDTVRGGIIIAGTPRALWEIMAMQNRDMIAQMPEAEQGPMLAVVEEQVAIGERLMAMNDEELDEVLLFGVPARYHKELMTPDPLETLRAMERPVLILQGGRDFQVSAVEDYPLWVAGLEGADYATFRLYPELSHAFVPISEEDYTGTIADYSHGGHVDAAVVADIAGWIHER